MVCKQLHILDYINILSLAFISVTRYMFNYQPVNSTHFYINYMISLINRYNLAYGQWTFSIHDVI